MSTPITPGSRPFPIPDYSAALDATKDEALINKALKDGPVFDGDRLIIAHHAVPLADEEFLFASVNGLTDRSRLEVGTLREVMPYVLATAIKAPASFRGSYDLLRLSPPPADDQRLWWKTALAKPVESREIAGPEAPFNNTREPREYTIDHYIDEEYGREFTFASRPTPAITNLPGLIVFDGPIFEKTELLKFISFWPIPWVAFIHHGDVQARNKDLLFNPDFFEWLGNALPHTPAILAGSSFGGLAAYWGHLHYPERYPYAISLSAPWVRMEELPDSINDHNFYAASGSLEWLMEASSTLMDERLTTGMRYFTGGHDKYCWTHEIAKAINTFFPFEV
ncbi:MAG: alpha/beta hydrolase-fold protein [Corynebacterium sp.]|nr:alpha/beta hydrolase-fold protein [Corynebacterium sp.]